MVCFVSSHRKIERRIQALRKHGRPANNGKGYNSYLFDGNKGNSQSYILARLARDHPDILGKTVYLSRHARNRPQNTAISADLTQTLKDMTWLKVAAQMAIFYNASVMVCDANYPQSVVYLAGQTAICCVEIGRDLRRKHFVICCLMLENIVYCTGTTRPITWRIGPVAKDYTARTFRDLLTTDGDERAFFGINRSEKL